MNSEGDLPVTSFLRILLDLPAEAVGETPVLRDIAELHADGGNAGTRGIIRRRLDRRYAGIRVVYSELSKLDFKKAKPGAGLDEFVFDQTDFDRYKKISREDFNTFFMEGLDDFEDSFYKTNFMIGREAVRKAIMRGYRPVREYYSCVEEGSEAGMMNPLLLGILRTLHTSLDFAPLIKPEEALRECEIIIRFLQSKSELGEDALKDLSGSFPLFFAGLLRSLNSVSVIHRDGMTTTLSVRDTPPVLYGTFHPSNKAHTIPLAKFSAGQF
jgi:hypothetical protein